MKPLAVTALPTRKCNLNCAYCNIRNQNFLNELTWKQWAKNLVGLNKQFRSLCFFCLLGGDITTWGKNLVNFVREMAKTKIFWNFTTNGILLTEDFLKELKEAGLDSISVSLDTLKTREDKSENVKSQKTISLLDLLNELGFKELHCTVTVDKTNLEELPTIVEFLTSKKTYSEITPMLFSKNENYDYTSSYEILKRRLFVNKDKRKINKIMKKLVQMKKEGYLIHNTDNYLLNWSKFGIKQQWQCEYPVNLVPDADGSMRLCLQIKGKRVTKHSIKNLDFEKFLEDWYKDFEELCKGCYWNCQYEPKYIYEQTESLIAVSNYFNHKVKYAEKKIKT